MWYVCDVCLLFYYCIYWTSGLLIKIILNFDWYNVSDKVNSSINCKRLIMSNLFMDITTCDAYHDVINGSLYSYVGVIHLRLGSQGD